MAVESLPCVSHSGDVRQWQGGAQASARQGQELRSGPVRRLHAWCEALSRPMFPCLGVVASLLTSWLLMSLSMADADMDGFRLLEQVGLEMDLPVISKPPWPLTCIW